MLVEVGTTNKTHLSDYATALSENTGAILRVNPSNYRIVGFVEAVPVAELVKLKQRRPVLVIDDLGCGALIDLERFGLPHEPTVPESVAAGADVVCFSGDKLIGGPQAGIIVGKKDLIEKIRKHPLTRMLRVCKLTEAALQATLRLFLHPGSLLDANPTLRMAAVPLRDLKRKATTMKRRIEEGPGCLEVRVVKAESAMGGGSMPAVALESVALAVRSGTVPPDRLLALLRRNTPPIIARIKEGDVVLDVRTLLCGEERSVIEALRRIHGSGPARPEE
ncbi:MAG: L-seryl-tRNA(Sec) selenium transferase [Candidatus Riflebacteria bacterium]|nr:L-seryl-tRNA(Sec) selenium transferase [Candidatus Riflebacteria bacterium]